MKIAKNTAHDIATATGCNVASSSASRVLANLKAALSAAVLLSMITLVSVPSALAQDAETEAKFNAALQALESDRLRTARRGFSKILSDNPDLHRARLELARAYYLSYDYDKAQEQLKLVLDDPNTPPEVRATLLAFNAQIGEDKKALKKKHHWTPSIYLGAMYDSNVNVGPDREIVGLDRPTLGDGDVAGAEVLPESRETEDYAGVIRGGIEHSYNPGKTFNVGENSGFFVWQSKLNGYYRHYFDEDNFNLSILTLRTGPAWVVPRHWQASIGLQVDQLWLGEDRLALFYTLNPNFTWYVDKRWEFFVDAQITQRDYNDAQNKIRDGLYGSILFGGTRYLNDGKLALQAGVGYTTFITDEDDDELTPGFNADRAEFTPPRGALDTDNRFGHSGPKAYIGLVAKAWKNGTVYLRADWQQYDYDGVEFLSLPQVNNLDLFNRDDDEFRYSAGFQHSIQSGWMKKWDILGDATFIDNDSNVELLDYDRTQVNLGLSRSF